MNFKYNAGDLVGPNKILMLERTKKNKSNQWLGLFQCPLCKQSFECRIDLITSGDKKTCGCRKGNSKDITNQNFGRLTALYPTTKKTKNGITYWHCKCSCGKEKDIRITSLINGTSTSCGCYRTELKSNNLLNQTFGELLAIQNTGKKDSAGYFIWKCKCSCGNICEINSRSLISGNTKSCGFCKTKYLTEEKISQLLNQLNFTFERQKTFPDCINPKTNKHLKFDFYLPYYNCCIEYDGQQHFNSINYFGGEESLKATQYRDEIKNKYCKTHNIKLIRIPYTEQSKINQQYLKNKITHDREGVTTDEEN